MVIIINLFARYYKLHELHTLIKIPVCKTKYSTTVQWHISEFGPRGIKNIFDTRGVHKVNFHSSYSY